MRRRLPQYLPIGCFLSGTMRNADVVPALLDLLRNVRGGPSRARAWIKKDPRVMDIIENDYDDPDGIVGEAVAELWDIVAEYAPPYCTVGSHEGDGACYGVWPMLDSLEEDARCGTVARLADPADLATVDPDTSEAFTVTDHGNVTFWTAVRCGRGRRWIPVWDCV